MALLLLTNFTRCTWCGRNTTDANEMYPEYRFCCEADCIGLAPRWLERRKPLIGWVSRWGYTPHSPAWKNKVANAIRTASYLLDCFIYRKRIGL